MFCFLRFFACTTTTYIVCKLPDLKFQFFQFSVQVMILITGGHKAFALYKAIEEGVNHMWTVSAFQQHPQTVFVCDEDATLELRVKTVKYFKGNVAFPCRVTLQ